MKKGFTLAEILIVLAIIGVMTMITLSTIKNDSNSHLLYKSAFQTAETTTSELANDFTNFPGGVFTNVSTTYLFCNQFAANLNTIGTISCSTSTIPGTPNFTTTNGMRWYGFNQTFGASPSNYITVSVDIDGANKGLNTANSDIFQIIIYDTGKVTATGSSELAFLQQ